jgi:hypothetical protein
MPVVPESIRTIITTEKKGDIFRMLFTMQI